MKFNISFSAKRFSLAALVCAIAILSPALSLAADELFVTLNFKYGVKNLQIEKESFKTDEHNLYFSSLLKDGGRRWHKIQLIDGAADVSGEDFSAEPRPGLAGCGVAGLNEKKDRAVIKNMLCDGKILFGIPLEINKKKYHAAVASDWHLYVFSYGDLFAGRSFPVYKVPVGAWPSAALHSKNHIFVVTGDFIAGFRVADSLTDRERKILAPSVSAMNASDAARASISVSDGTINDFDCAARFAASNDIVYKKIATAKNIIASPKENFLYLLMGFGFGNANIYSMNLDFEFAKLTNFSGAMYDFALIDPETKSFSVMHSADPLVKSDGGRSEWKITPPSSIGGASDVPLLMRAGGGASLKGAVFSRRRAAGENYFKISRASGEVSLTLELVGENDDTAETVAAFDVHENLRQAWSGCPAALSSNSRRPLAFFYDQAGRTFRVYDIKRNKEYDSFYYNLGSAVLSGVRFSFDNELVMFRAEHFEDGKSGPVSSAIYVYKIINKSLMQIAAHRTIGDFDCVKHENKHKVILIYSRDKEYCDSIGALTIE
jgi:hypothetical protein